MVIIRSIFILYVRLLVKLSELLLETQIKDSRNIATNAIRLTDNSKLNKYFTIMVLKTILFYHKTFI